MTGLRTRRDIRQVGDDCYWLVFGPAGVIAFGLLNVARSSTTYGPISIHSPRPLLGIDPVSDCPFLEMPCYFDFSFAAGNGLGNRWDAAGRDDDVIWAELETWYAGQLAELAVTS